MKLWKGRFQKEADPKTNDFNSSISIDSRMYKEDIEGSIAHATMLGAAGIIDKGESEKICAELEKIEKDIETGALHIDPDAEDIHTFIEGELTARIGDAGKRLHTARSRNDHVIALGAHKRCLTGNGDGTAQVCHKDECAVQNADQQQRLSLILPADLCAHFPDFRLDLFLCDEDTLDLLFKFLGCHR